MRRPQRQPEAPTEVTGPVMPLRTLLGRFEDRYAWLRAHGIDPQDRAAVREVEAASHRAHGTDSALNRARAYELGLSRHDD